MKHVVIGGGVVGLSVARELSKFGATALLEKHPHLGMETSSHNSEVVHSGIYYPLDSLKTKLCRVGHAALHDLANRDAIPIKNCGKWICATNAAEEEKLYGIHLKCEKLGVPSQYLTTDQILKGEPAVCATQVLCIPSTSIIDSHSLMMFLAAEIQNSDGMILTGCGVTRVERTEGSVYRITTQSHGNIETDVVINCCGLDADKFWSQKVVGAPLVEEYTQTMCHGLYGTYPHRVVSRLVYPCPLENLAGLGTHCTIDMDGNVRFGPDVCWDIDTCHPYEAMHLEGRMAAMRTAATSYLKGIDASKIQYAYSGLRPKLSRPGEPARDFVIAEESARGFEGFVNLLGIESPGLTASIGIAEYVRDIVYR